MINKIVYLSMYYDTYNINKFKHLKVSCITYIPFDLIFHQQLHK